MCEFVNEIIEQLESFDSFVSFSEECEFFECDSLCFSINIDSIDHFINIEFLNEGSNECVFHFDVHTSNDEYNFVISFFISNEESIINFEEYTLECAESDVCILPYYINDNFFYCISPFYETIHQFISSDDYLNNISFFELLTFNLCNFYELINEEKLIYTDLELENMSIINNDFNIELCDIEIFDIDNNVYQPIINNHMGALFYDLNDLDIKFFNHLYVNEQQIIFSQEELIDLLIGNNNASFVYCIINILCNLSLSFKFIIEELIGPNDYIIFINNISLDDLELYSSDVDFYIINFIFYNKTLLLQLLHGDVYKIEYMNLSMELIEDYVQHQEKCQFNFERDDVFVEYEEELELYFEDRLLQHQEYLDSMIDD